MPAVRARRRQQPLGFLVLAAELGMTSFRGIVLRQWCVEGISLHACFASGHKRCLSNCRGHVV
jgi:hypothetical protein